ncbi:PQQ-like beta-propeller repeat protein [Blastopirellula sp. JC732]|uniref:PQQ-like beta-propeller repeat protein n=1 Tax=Blastopirellula sediminis TaxID=2894196 RepID=A0A9X1SEY1_9BACT|nr:PQQ-binding-like beta-propeller repeat protein [Blastopirellula sediminis]MCC9608151.1 PQQ-like beta-propeller repeat protein [Blastopirellula sediminis]MCC9627056.1 PQQ-like beta-propeller repeat protein [Blastopirellula sediminis]
MTEPVDTSQGSEDSTTPDRAPRMIPPLRTWLLCGLFLLLAIFGQSVTELGDGPLAGLRGAAPIVFDGAVGNVMTLIGAFFFVATPMIWFALFSGYDIYVRIAPIIFSLTVVGIFFIFFKIQHVDGEMKPKFAYRFAPVADQRLGELEGDGGGEGLSTKTTEHDFPQFLGPDRNLVVAGPNLSDWNANPPQEVWRRPIGAGWSSFSVVGDLAYTMEQRGPSEYVSCYRVADGEPVWTFKHDARHETVLGYVGPRATPLIHNGKVYAVGATAKFFCLDAATGKLQWEHDLLAEFDATVAQAEAITNWGRSSSPLLYPGKERELIILPAGGPTREESTSLVAYDAESGEKVWTGGKEPISYASVNLFQLGDETEAIIVNESSVAGHNPETGEQLWITPWPGSSAGAASCSQAVDIGDGKILVTKGYAIGAKVFLIEKGADGKYAVNDIWEDNRLLKTKFTNVAIKDGYIYGLNDGILECVTAEDGDRQWRERGFGHGQLLMVGDKLLVMTEDGELVLVDATPDGYHEAGRIQALESEISPNWNNLCITGDLLLVRNAEQAACYRLATEEKP